MMRLEKLADGSVSARNFDRVESTYNELTQHVSVGDGVPSHTPDGRQLYIRRDGGAGTTLYVYEGGSWAAK